MTTTRPGEPRAATATATEATSLLDEIEGPIRAEHLPRAFDRLEHAVFQLLDAMPDFEAGTRLTEQLGAETACLHEAARHACLRAGIAWTSELDRRRAAEFRTLIFGRSRTSGPTAGSPPSASPPKGTPGAPPDASALEKYAESDASDLLRGLADLERAEARERIRIGLACDAALRLDPTEEHALAYLVAHRRANLLDWGRALDRVAELEDRVAELEKRSAAHAGWRRDVPPRGVRCLVTWTGTGGRSPPRVRVASVSLDCDEECWFSDGERLHHVVAWMSAPEAARDET